MSYYIYIGAGGGNFDPVRFNESLGDELKGTVRIRDEYKYSPERKGVIRTGKIEKVWRSKIFKGDYDEPITILHNLLLEYKTAVLTIKDIPNIIIYAEFVVTYESWEKFRGFCFEHDTIQLIADIGAGLDMDLYCNFGEPEERSGDS